MSRDLPAFLVDAFKPAPMDLSAIGTALDRDLAQLIRVCGDELRVLGSRRARDPLAVEMSLVRVSSVIAVTYATAQSCAAALERTNPYMLTLARAEPLGASPVPFSSDTPRRLSRGDCRAEAEHLRRALRDVPQAAGRIQAALRGQDAATSSVVVIALAQTRTLCAWLRHALIACGAEQTAERRSS